VETQVGGATESDQSDWLNGQGFWFYLKETWWAGT